MNIPTLQCKAVEQYAYFVCFRYDSRGALVGRVILKTPGLYDMQLMDTTQGGLDVNLITLLDPPSNNHREAENMSR